MAASVVFAAVVAVVIAAQIITRLTSVHGQIASPKYLLTSGGSL